jgi:hypothetical protein
MKTKEELNADFDAEIEELNPTYAESEMIYTLKNYIDARLRLIENKKQNATNDN